MEVYGNSNDIKDVKKHNKRQDAMDSITASPKAAENLKQLSWIYKNDENFLLDAIEKQPAVYMYVHKKFKNDPEFVRKAIVKNLKYLESLQIDAENCDKEDLKLVVLEEEGVKQPIQDYDTAKSIYDKAQTDAQKKIIEKGYFLPSMVKKVCVKQERKTIDARTNQGKFFDLIKEFVLDKDEIIKKEFITIAFELDQSGKFDFDKAINTLRERIKGKIGDKDYIKYFNNTVKQINKFLDSKEVDVNKPDGDGHTLVYYIAKNNNPIAWYLLKQKGAVVDKKVLKDIKSIKNVESAYLIDAIRDYSKKAAEPAKPKENNGQTEQTSVETPKEETAEATTEGTEKKKGLFERLKAHMQKRKSDKATNKLYKLLTKGPFNKDDKEEADRLIKEEGANINKAVSRMSKQNRYPDEAWAYLTEKLPELKQEEEKLKQKPKENNGQTEQTSVETPKEETAEATAERTEKKKGWFERLKAHMQKRKSDKNQQKLNKLLIKALKADKFDKKVVEELIQQGAVITDKKIKGKTKYSKEACEFIQQLAQPQVQQPKSEESNNETVETPKEAPKKEFANEEEKFVWDTYQELCDLKLPAGYSFEKLKSKLEQIAKTSKTTEVKEKAEDCIEILNYLRKKLDLTIEKIDSKRSIKEIAIEREDALKFKKTFDKEFAEQKNKEAAEKENKKLLEKLNKIVKTKQIDIRRGQQSSEEEKE